ncbi:TIGR04222 domain-containing membrane protein [Streptomyces fagopyri]|uniref:TIGR04222 domain-containing membrane protein n=2 Tax=Streptomyces fagopyri TaxID=2662397 RepID=A0A5Q0LQK3_9ACTN|nr:TIGR04222 domain-containing membrane protein [Streptomyces fagopyri]
MGDGMSEEPDPYAVALVRVGPRAAVTVAVLALRLRGAVEAGRPGTMRTSRAPAPTGHPPERSAHPLERAVHASLYRPAGMVELLRRTRVRQSLAQLRTELSEAGTLRTFPPGPTLAARRLLRRTRAERPLPTGREGLSRHDVLLAVALHGAAALTLLEPRFAVDAGLVGRGGTADKGLLPHSWGGGCGGGYTDGGGGSDPGSG